MRAIFGSFGEYLEAHGTQKFLTSGLRTLLIVSLTGLI